MTPEQKVTSEQAKLSEWLQAHKDLGAVRPLSLEEARGVRPEKPDRAMPLRFAMDMRQEEAEERYKAGLAMLG